MPSLIRDDYVEMLVDEWLARRFNTPEYQARKEQLHAGSVKWWADHPEVAERRRRKREKKGG